MYSNVCNHMFINVLSCVVMLIFFGTIVILAVKFSDYYNELTSVSFSLSLSCPFSCLLSILFSLYPSSLPLSPPLSLSLPPSLSLSPPSLTLSLSLSLSLSPSLPFSLFRDGLVRIVIRIIGYELKSTEDKNILQ